MIEVQKKDNESAISLVKRFNYRLQQSGNLARARVIQFKKRPKTALAQKKAGLWKINKRMEIKRLRKLGKIE